MAEYGTPTRTPIGDAASGNIKAPKKRVSVVQGSKIQQGGYESNALQESVNSFASGIGSALEQYTEDKGASLRAQKTLDAAARQGESAAINEVDADNRRTGWQNVLFGQDAGYVEAQRRAATNAVRENAIEVSANMVTHAGTPPEEFREQLSKQKKDLLSKYDDVDTRTLVSEMFDKSAEGLSRTHYKDHAANTQMQNKETATHEMQLIVDQVNQDATSGISTPDAANKLVLEPMKAIFSHKNKPTTQSDQAYKQVIADTLNRNLAQGNVAFYRAAKANGYLDKLDDKQQKALQTAIGKYEGKIKDEAAYIVESAQSQAYDAQSESDVDAIYDSALDALNGLDMRSLDLSFAHKKAIAGQESEAKVNRHTFMQRFKALDKEREKAAEKAIKLEVAANQDKENKRTFEASLGGTLLPEDPTQDPQVSDLVQPVLSKKDGTKAQDSVIMDRAMRIAGNDQLTPREASGLILTDDAVNKRVLSVWKQNEHSSDIVDSVVSAYVNSDLSQLVDENGKLLPEAMEQLGMVERFYQASPKKFSAAAGPTGLAHYLMKRNGMNAGHTIDRINKDIDRFDTNKLEGKDNYIPTVDSEGKNVSKINFVSQFMGSEVGRTVNTSWFGGSQVSDTRRPTSTSVSEALGIFETGVKIYKGDAEAAKDYTLDVIRNSAETVTLTSKSSEGKEYESAHVIMGASELQKQLDAPLGDLINYGENQEFFAKAIEGLLGDTSVLDKKNQLPVTKLSEVANLEIYTITGYDGIFLNTPSSPNPFPITLEQLQELDGQNKRQKNRKAMDEENKKIVERKAVQSQASSGRRRGSV